MTYLASKDYFVNVAAGNVPGASILIMQGEQLSLKGADRNQLYLGTELVVPTPASAETMDIVSTSANDSTAGSGAKTVKITGLDNSGNIVTDTVTMSGLTPVTTTQSFKRVFFIEVVTIGTVAGGIPSGRITCEGNTSGDEYAVLEGKNRAGTGSFTVPTGKEAILGPLTVSLSPGGKVAFIRTEMQTRSSVANSPWIVRMRVCQITDANSDLAQDNTYPQVFPVATDMRFVYSATEADTVVFARLHIILQDA